MKNIPKLRFPEFVNSGEWEEKRLGEIASFFKGRNISKADISHEAITPCIRYGELYTQYQEIIKEIVSKTNLPMSQLVFSQKNDVLIPSSGETKIDIATASCVMLDNIALGGDINIIRSNQDGIFMSYYLNGSKKMDIAKIAQGDTVVHLYSSQLQQLNISFPSLQEQQKIADCLSSVDSLISAQSQKVELLKEHKKGLMQQLFPQDGEEVPKLRFPEFKNATKWEEKEVGEIFQVTRGYVLSMSLVTDKQVEKHIYPVYSSQTKNNGLAGYYPEYLYEDAITWTTDGANAGDVNYRKGKFYCTNVCGVLLNNEGYANACIAEIINSVSKNYVSYVGNPKLMNGIMSKIPIKVPSLLEQQKIGDCLSSIDEQITAQTTKLQTLKEHKKALMQQLFPNANSKDK